MEGLGEQAEGRDEDQGAFRTKGLGDPEGREGLARATGHEELAPV